MKSYEFLGEYSLNDFEPVTRSIDTPSGHVDESHSTEPGLLGKLSVQIFHESKRGLSLGVEKYYLILAIPGLRL